MPTRKEKEETVARLKEKLGNAKVVVLADYRGLNVAAMNSLRRKMRESDSELLVAKNTLIRLAARELGIEGLDPYLEGPTALSIGNADPVAPAKILTEFAKEYKQLEIKGGYLEGRVIDAAGVKALADLPPREVLLSKIMGGMKAPLYGFAFALQGLLRSFVYVLEAVRKEKEKEVGAAG